jgi:hypothetical protein
MLVDQDDVTAAALQVQRGADADHAGAKNENVGP